MNLKRFAPFIVFVAIAGTWFNYATKPRLIRGNELAREISTLESDIAEWDWIDSIEAPAAIPPTSVSHMSIKELTAKVNACQVSLARLGEGTKGSDFEVRSDYPCMIHFLASVSNSSCQLRSMKKNDDGTLLASLSMKEQ